MSRYLFDEMAIERDVVCLLSIINASEKNHDLLSEYLPEPGIFYTEWTLIQELLIGTAVKLRLIDELFRKACNKIIYAKNFVPQSKISKIIDDYEDRVYRPFIKLNGKKENQVGMSLLISGSIVFVP